MIIADGGHLEWRINDIMGSSREEHPGGLTGKRNYRANGPIQATPAPLAPRREGRVVTGTAPQSHAGTLTDPRFLAGIREEMRRFAMHQLRNREEAEDAVQEALIGALKNAGSF